MDISFDLKGSPMDISGDENDGRNLSPVARVREEGFQESRLARIAHMGASSSREATFKDDGGLLVLDQVPRVPHYQQPRAQPSRKNTSVLKGKGEDAAR